MEEEKNQKTFSLAQEEEKILHFWQENNIFQKSLENRKGAKEFIFYEGPPTANGRPGLHHMLARSFKDLICRYQTMRGHYVLRRAGWDTHGLPVEIEVEKELNLKNKNEIESYGIEKFNAKAKESVWRYKEEWENLTQRMGYWLDLEHPYITCENDYLETVFWLIKKIYQKGYLYQDYRVVPYCSRCGTPLSSHELSQGYETVKDPSLYLKFEIPAPKNEKLKAIKDKKNKKIFLLVWTTTPWTLPANVAIAVDENLTYQIAEKENEIFISYRWPEGESFSIIDSVFGKDLIGEKYLPLYQWKNFPESQKIYEVVKGDFISQEEGTGLVHLAPAFGEDDLKIGQKENLPLIINVDENGLFTGEPEQLKEFQGQFFQDLNPVIFNDLEKRGLILTGDLKGTLHEYPFCWRCHTPLIYYAKKAWFIKMSALKEKIIENNEKIHWEPEHLKEGRFGQWLKDLKDWTISRNRYWGTPLPIWQCENCSFFEVIGSLEELKEKGGDFELLKNSQGEIDLHRPYLDKIELTCPQCQGKMKRVEEVLDCWFDSGSMPYASWHWPFNQFKKEEWEKMEPSLMVKKIPFPADFICEAIDQTRGWFYTLLAISTLLDLEPAYKNVICVGLVLDEKGEKMSKSKGNIVEPMSIFQKYGADILRWYFYALNSPDENKKFTEKDLIIYQNRIFNTFFNVLNFYLTYADLNKENEEINSQDLSLLDKWLLSYLKMAEEKITLYLDNFKVNEASRLIDDLIDNLSRWYIRRSRRVFQKKENLQQWQVSSRVLLKAIKETTLILAPFCPFSSEIIFQKIRSKNDQVSVHLMDWPSFSKEEIDFQLIEKMEQVKNLASLALASRQEKQIKLRQPLKTLILKDTALSSEEELLSILKDEVNVKEIKFDNNLNEELTFDFSLSEDLIEEGILREVIRKIQAFRGENNLLPTDKIVLGIIADKDLEEILKKNEEIIKKEALIQELIWGEKLSSLVKEINLEKGKIIFSLKTNNQIAN
ncbi:MAG TPA: isoleucine--tRNA ligase [Candidatus Paceibacterota bacterium]|nr:isoleucine--tRNA ligase [Candidatus Paceibacterota bacterium]